ncbi:MAG: hypothetical protein JNL83_30080 [Myxococcales bacterium]|nr:hypothetical protein [Myxococcales bacterium]
MVTRSDAVRNAADRDAKSGTLVEVFGTYQQVAVAKAPGASPGPIVMSLGVWKLLNTGELE